MLVRAFQVQIGREFRFVRVRAAQDGLMRGAGIEPDIERVLVFHIHRRLVAE